MLLATAGGYARADDNEQINGVDNSVRLWDMRTLRPVSELVDHTEHEPRNQVRPERFFRLPKSRAVHLAVCVWEC